MDKKSITEIVSGERGRVRVSRRREDRKVERWLEIVERDEEGVKRG